MQKKFNDVSSDFNLVPIEKEVLENWKKYNIFQKVDERNIGINREWVYYDGPITANGIPHYGHAITWTMKDILPRYYTMKGYHVSRNIGWDCQGILVEYEVEKSLKIEHKSDIENMGIDKFNKVCRDSVLRFRKDMIDYETRLGRWIDHKDEYSTMDPNYIESIWWAFKNLYEKGLLYKGHKVVAYSTRAGMTLSSHEVADGGYSEVIDPAVIIKFKSIDQPKTYFLAWTTTPWTLPGNLLLAIGKKFSYVKVTSNGEYYILAKLDVEKTFGSNKYKILEEIGAKELVGMKYEPLFPYYSEKAKEGLFQIITADHVNTEEGTGIVHLAPYGEDDFNIFLKMGIKLFDYLDETGNFNEEIPEYKGLFYKKANKKIIEDLKTKNLLFDYKEYSHSMPISYRTKEPLIYKPIESWYVNVNKIKPKLIEEAKKLNWVPESGGTRFVNWVNNARDWSLSRMRYWGTPLPVWQNEKTNEIVVIGSFRELEEYSGKRLPDNFDPHKPFVDEISWGNEETGIYRRVPEVIDVWFDSGSMPYAQYHYPFENVEKFKKTYPAEYISESEDQIRLWFYTMFVLGVALFDKKPFNNVVVTGMLCDEEGKKMSKSKGNYPPIEEVFENYGSDMLRYFLLSSPITRGDFTNFSYNYLLDTKKDFFNTLWNSYRYFVTYANLNQFNFDPEQLKNRKMRILDKWILLRLEEVKHNMNSFIDNYEVMYAIRELSPFIDDLSNWYIRRSRDLLSDGDLISMNILYYILVEVTKLMAPFLPLLSENMYKNLTGKISVHLEKYPETKLIHNTEQKNLIEDMQLTRDITSIGNSIRKSNNIPVRQPLSVSIYNYKKSLSKDYIELIKDEINVKDVRRLQKDVNTDNLLRSKNQDLEVFIDPKITKALEIEMYSRELIREIQKIRKEEKVEWDRKVSIQIPDKIEYIEAVDTYKDKIMKRTLSENIIYGKDFKIL